MRVELDQERFVEGLRTVARAAATRNAIAALTGVLLEASQQELVLRATDLELSIAHSLRAKVEQPGAALVPARHLFELVRRLPPGELALRVDPGSTTVRLRSQELEAVIHGLPEEQFPAAPRPVAGGAVTLDRSELHGLLRETGFATAHDESRPWFTGVFLTIGGQVVRAVATDGAVLACAERSVSNPAELGVQVILPGRSAQEIARVAAESDGARCEILPMHNHLRFRLGDTEVSTRLLEGQYPDVARVLPASYASTLTLQSERFIAACDRALLISRDGTLKLQGSPDGLHLSARSSEVGSVGERIPAALRGAPFEVGLNARLLLDGLRAMGTGSLLLEFAGPRTAVRFRRGADARSFFAVMPLVSF